ncbi:putative hydro-lyase [Fodinicurvata halophila]|uniref:Putative hydro-lyase ACFOW6_04570 n=1 Tax=Fodinicurvata halophila TaxID=1419723 RepID=A0ABV8UIC5_9PROT
MMDMPSPQESTPRSNAAELRSLSPQALRQVIRRQDHTGPTMGLAPGYLQGNLAILPQAQAFDFLLFCQRNPKPCPIIGLAEAGAVNLPELGQDIDIRSDLPAYRVFRNGIPQQTVTDLDALWREDLVSFVIGCSFSFEEALEEAGIPLRHLQAGSNVPMYRTSISTVPAGAFSGPLVVSMRAFPSWDAIHAILLSDRFRLAHGAPVHIGEPAQIGIKDLDTPDFGDPPYMEEGDIPVFWACGVTPQLALRHCGADLAITHAPGHMLVTDLPSSAAEARLSGLSSFRPSDSPNP